MGDIHILCYSAPKSKSLSFVTKKVIVTLNHVSIFSSQLESKTVSSFCVQFELLVNA